jgi:mono/diheme cytochrome c family protein
LPGPTLAARLLALLLVALCPLPAGAQDGQVSPLIERGAYLMQLSGCRHCHTAEDGEPFAGGRPLETPFGTFYTPNITADDSTGIGAWSETDFVRALRHGETPDGSHYYPAFPYTSYTRMTDEDARALFAYLRSQTASKRTNREHDLAWYLQWRLAAQAWKWLFFTPGEYQPDNARSPAWNRGAYIAEALAHCGECHTPRNWFGAANRELAYAGNPDGPDDELVPNITPDPETGTGDWSRDSLDLFLRFGELPNGEYTAGSMDYVITGIGKLTETDRAALIDYLRALPPIRNSVSN